MMEDVFLNFLLPAVVVVNTIMFVFVSIDFFKCNRANKKKNEENFRNACTDFLNNLDEFLRESKKIPDNIVEAVSPVIDRYVKERVEYYIKEYFSRNTENTTQEPSVENNADKDYQSMFLHEPCNQFLARTGKQVVIRESYHSVISHLVDTTGSDCRSIFGFVDNVLADHFQKHGDSVKEILTDNLGTV